MNTEISQSVLDKINEEAYKHVVLFDYGENALGQSVKSDPIIPQSEFDTYVAGAKLGYSLSREEIEKLEKELERVKGLVKAAHYAGWYNGMVNAYKHDFSWDEFVKNNNLEYDQEELWLDAFQIHDRTNSWEESVKELSSIYHLIKKQ